MINRWLSHYLVQVDVCVRAGGMMMKRLMDDPVRVWANINELRCQEELSYDDGNLMCAPMLNCERGQIT